MTDELLFRSAVALADDVRSRRLSPVELVGHCLERIEALDAAYNSVVTLDAERALERAAAAADVAGEADAPPFLGVPILVKDLHLTEGLRTTFGTASMAEFVPPIDDEAVARLRRAGFVIVGKSHVPEFGTSPVTESALLGPCRNPWDTARTAGGSSGGSAAAVAAGLVPVAHGSDGGGSARIPASNCGIVGVKPARGRVSNAPLFGDRIAGLSTNGVLARHVVDGAAVLDCMRGYVTGDPSWAPDPVRPYREEVALDPPALRVGLVTEYALAPYDPQAVAAAEETARLLEDAGHRVTPTTLPVGEQLTADFQTLWATGVAAQPLDPATYEPFNAALARIGRERSAAELLAAVNSIQAQCRAVVGACEAFDVVLMPTITRVPARIGEFAGLDVSETLDAMTAYVGLCPLANLTGQPAMSLPLGWGTDDGATLPVGVMLVGRPADEATLIRLGGQLERAVDWPRRRPPVPAPAAAGKSSAS